MKLREKIEEFRQALIADAEGDIKCEKMSNQLCGILHNIASELESNERVLRSLSDIHP